MIIYVKRVVRPVFFIVIVGRAGKRAAVNACRAVGYAYVGNGFAVTKSTVAYASDAAAYAYAGEVGTAKNAL